MTRTCDCLFPVKGNEQRIAKLSAKGTRVEVSEDRELAIAYFEGKREFTALRAELGML